MAYNTQLRTFGPPLADEGYDTQLRTFGSPPPPPTGEPPNQTSTAADRLRSQAAQSARYQAQADARSGSLGSGEPPNQTKTSFPDAVKPAPTSSGGSSSGGGGGGGGGYTATKISAPSNSQFEAALGEIAAARASAQQEKAGLDALFEDKRDELRAEFQFAETDSERDQIARILTNLEQQRSDGYKAIGAGYRQAVAGVQERAAGQQVAAREAGDRVAGQFNQAGDRILEDAASMNARYAGAGVNADGGTVGGLDALTATRARAASQAALAEQLGQLSAEDAFARADSMTGQGLAQQADLNRLHMGTSASAQETHASRVAQRIQQERAQWRSQLAAMQQQFTGRRFDLGDQDRNLQVQSGDLRFRAGESAADRALQVAMANASAANAAARSRASGGGGGSGGSAGAGSMLSPDDQAALMWADIWTQSPAHQQIAREAGYDFSSSFGGPAPAPSGSSGGGRRWNPLENTPRGR